MADIAGLVLSVATAWKTCVQIFDIIDSSRKYGMDYEILRIKLEVERVRLLAWGEAVGLTGLGNSQFMPDPRLQSREIQSMVIQLLGCVQKMFENSETLQSKYGLRPSAALTDNQVNWGRATPQAQTALGSIFTRAYSNLQRSAKERQRSTTLARKTLWAVHDRKKFRTMVAEIKGFNENLESLFPDVKVKAAEAMRQDIGRSDQIQDLRLLQEATAGEHEDISESASVRLETLGAATMDLSDILSAEDETVRLGESDEEDDCGSAVGQGEGEDGWKTPRTGEKKMDELSKRLHEVELFEGKKGKGALCVSLLKPDSSLARASTHVRWEGYPQEQTWRIHVIERKTVIGVPHGSFELYHRKKFTQKRQIKHEMHIYSDEYFVFFDIESDPQYESAHPGTVTLEGFGLECWDYEIIFGTKRDINILISYNDLPILPGSKILRRMDELYRETGQVGWNPWHDMADLREFTGALTAMTLAGSKFVQPQLTALLVADLYSLLNRRDIFADFTTKSSIAEEWGGPTGQCIGLWNFFRQMVITRELARRLASYDVDRPVMGFTTKILASLIIADRWFQNVQIRLADMGVDRSSIPKTVTSLQKDKAENFKRQGNEATRKKQHQLAVDLYTEAIKIDLGNAVYRNNRSGALYDLGRYPEALDDALVATKLDPTYAKAWARLGLAHLRLGRGKRAKEALQRAIELAGRNVTDTMRKGLEDADAKIEADMKAVEGEKNKERKRSLHAAFLDEDWDLTGRTVQMHSRVYGRQTEGLILFAERMRWPYLNEVRDYAEAVYGDLVGGQTTPSHLHDWMFGMMLPGKWFAFKIMSALIICTRSICHIMNLAPYYDCGVSLPQAFYWRVRTPLGSILACLPGVISLNGWVGPCPPVQFISSLDANKPRHIRLHARRVAPFTADRKWDNRPVVLRGENIEYEARWMKPGEEVEPYLAAMTDRDQWILPEPPVQQVSVCEVKAIELQALPSPKSVAAPALGVEMREQRMDSETEYRARIVFQMDDSEQTVTYSLYTNPIFGTLPACRPGPKGGHEVHMRELSQYQNIWTVERLNEHSADTVDDPDSVMIINATGQGGELLARAWCAERGRNAIVRRAGGPCFVCTVRAAGRYALGIGVVIWVS